MIEYNAQPASIVRTNGQSGFLIRALALFNVADLLTLVYLVYTTLLIIFFRHNIPNWAVLVPIHFALMALVFGLAQARRRGIRGLSFLSHWYPVLMYLFFFEEIGSIVHAIFPGWFDELLIKADFAIFGFHPTVWVEQFSNYWLNEYMQAAYISYFLMTIGLGAWFWLRGERRQFAILLASTTAAYYICYTLFVYIPIESPHHTLSHMQEVDLLGGPFTAFINLIEKHGRVHGGAFPSSHVAGSMVTLFIAYIHARRLGYLLTPVVLSIAVSTVYGRYHYAMDVFAGTLVAALGVWIGTRLHSWRERILTAED